MKVYLFFPEHLSTALPHSIAAGIGYLAGRDFYGEQALDFSLTISHIPHNEFRRM
jgi:hypothetical protein